MLLASEWAAARAKDTGTVHYRTSGEISLARWADKQPYRKRRREHAEKVRRRLKDNSTSFPFPPFHLEGSLFSPYQLDAHPRFLGNIRLYHDRQLTVRELGADGPV